MVRDDELPLTRRIIELECMHMRYGYRRITALLRRDGWYVYHKRVERIWKPEGSRCRRSSGNGVGSGSTMARASGSGPSTAIMYGVGFKKNSTDAELR